MTPNQQQLSKILPSYYQKLANLPDEICQQLIPLAYYVKGDGLYGIQARVKLENLLSMTESEIIKSFTKFKEINNVKNHRYEQTSIINKKSSRK